MDPTPHRSYESLSQAAAGTGMSTTFVRERTRRGRQGRFMIGDVAVPHCCTSKRCGRGPRALRVRCWRGRPAPG